VYCYEKNGRGRAVVVEYEEADHSWMKEIDENSDEFIFHYGELSRKKLKEMIADGKVIVDPEPISRRLLRFCRCCCCKESFVDLYVRCRWAGGN
jgi:anti-sigma28 factor (negative regulator of flagellin synthesis)